MYSWEITQLMERHSYNLPSYVYLNVTENSPQIKGVTYNTYSNRFEMWDQEGESWIFEVFYEAA